MPLQGGAVHLWVQVAGLPWVGTAGRCALQPVDGAEAFVDAGGRETGFVKVPVGVAGEHEAAVRHALTPLAQQGVSGVGLFGATQVQQLAIHAPRRGGVFIEGLRRGHFFKAEPLSGNCWPGVRKGGCVAQVWQAAVGSHTLAGSDHQRAGALQQVCGALEFVGQQIVGLPVGVGVDVPGVGVCVVVQCVASQSLTQGAGVFVSYAQPPL